MRSPTTFEQGINLCDLYACMGMLWGESIIESEGMLSIVESWTMRCF